MPQAERTVTIQRSIDDVFAFFTDFDNDRKWRPHLKEVVAPAEVRNGSTVRQVLVGPGGRDIRADFEITAFDRPSLVAFTVIAGPVRPLGRFRFAPAGSGTEVTFSLQAHLGGIKGLFMSKPVQKSMDSQMAALDKAKALLESS
ncbi:MAG: SRPBCC family protein [Solirubrobacteraceae bacterium]